MVVDYEDDDDDDVDESSSKANNKYIIISHKQGQTFLFSKVEKNFNDKLERRSEIINANYLSLIIEMIFNTL